jgi:hypothetical protein
MRKPRSINRYSTSLALAALATVTILALVNVALAQAQVATPSWTFTGSLNTANAGPATLLPNGKVLVVGGGAELYDPAKGIWSKTADPIFETGTATLLQNGKVLVVGGGAELYDPATGAWSLTGNLNVPRFPQTATLLKNGKVLVTGGQDDISRSPTDTAELYDPNTGAWSVTGRLNTARAGHTATLLQNGKVLVAGGTNDGDFSVTFTELYDPTTGTWSITGSLNAARGGHTATLLPNGDVLVAGACNDGIYCGNNSSAELYNPITGTWSITGALNTPRFFHTATLLPNGQVLIAGGLYENFFSGTEAFLDSAEIYDAAHGNWNTTANLNAPRLFHTATLLQNGKVLVVGGYDDANTPLRSAELYDSGVVVNPNPIDDAQFFVRQQYLDFLNREPDADGMAFWTDQITSCGGDPQCVEVKRINVSAAYFLSIEFQQTGYLVYRTYKASYGNLPDAPVPIRFSEFLPDTQQIGHGVVVKQTGWESVLENNKQAFMSEFVQRPRFVSAYPPSLSPPQFVDALFANAAVVPSTGDRAAATNEFGGTLDTSDAAARARALRRVAENSALQQQELNRAFVLMQYFGYLRRNPNDAPEAGLNFAGYNFWLNKLDSFNGDFAQAEMVKAFINSAEYRQRFGP